MIGRTPHEEDLAAAGNTLNASIARQLRDLARLIEARTDLPLDHLMHAETVYFAGSPAEVDAIAARLGVTASSNGGSYAAEYRTGTNVAYRVVHIQPAYSAAYDEAMAGMREQVAARSIKAVA